MKQRHRFIFLYDGEVGQVFADCRPGDAERIARQLAREVAAKYHAADVRCVWHGAEDDPVPRKLLSEVSA